MAKADIWMPLYIGDYLRGTTRLNTEQHGAYLLLIMDYWGNGPPPDDDTILASICRASPQSWKKLKPVISGFFTAQDGAWHHARIDDEIQKAKNGKEKAGAKAAAAAEARWGKEAAKHDKNNAPSNTSSYAPSIDEALHKECPSPSPTSLKTKPKSKADATASRLPADWTPDPGDIEFCKTERPDLDPLAVAAQFVDYWIAQPGVKGRKVSWPATWRNWVRNQRAAQPRAGPAKPEKFDPLAYINRNRTSNHERTIDIDANGEPV